MPEEIRHTSADYRIGVAAPDLLTSRLAYVGQLFIGSLCAWQRLPGDPQLRSNLLRAGAADMKPVNIGGNV